MRHRTTGFTMIELLVVIGIISILTALLLPAFFTAQGKGRSAVCLSNLHQIGLSVETYSQDYDDEYPFGADPTDQWHNAAIWQFSAIPNAQAEVRQMPLLSNLLQPYEKSKGIWQCPSDTGVDVVDTNPLVNLDAHPSMFEATGMSYLARTEIAIYHESLPSLTGYETTPPCAQHGPAEVNLIMDASGSWHGHGSNYPDRRYNVLMGDFHVVSLNGAAYEAAWALDTQNPCI